MQQASMLSRLSDYLKHNQLPKAQAWAAMAPPARLTDLALYNQNTNCLSPAAVAVNLYCKDGQWFFPLIRRNEDGLPHSGQMALPGGRIEPGESAIDAAIRECQEEIGLALRPTNVIGQLSPLPIPVSNFLVIPIVTTCSPPKAFIRQEREVAAIYEINLTELLAKDSKDSFLYQGTPTPCYRLAQQIVWGATAMILSELEYIWIRGQESCS